ncbi:MAG: hypothetical protein PUH24_06765 [Prevotellaceae bacterium]|nr:hypothetical protein [Prevotella sp.]MDD7257949.1 hypothetical protein [Prevotellaceae bacterium]MDY6129860.1 hypothetical protein [Prevotella sp.]
MKHLIYGAVVLLLLALTSCDNDDPSVVIPEVTAELIDAGTDFVKLSVETKNAESGAWLCLPASQRKPSPSTILTTGKPLSTTNGKQELQVGGLKQNTGYIIYVAARNATEVTTATLAASTSKAYAYEMAMTDGWLAYHGNFYKNRVGYYMLTLCDGPISKSGLPTRVGDKAVHFFLGDAIATDGDNAMVTPGTYRISDGHDVSTVDAYNSRFIVATIVENGEATQGYVYKYVDGTVTVNHDAEGTYSIVAEMRIEREGTEEFIKCTFNGKLPFTNRDPARYNPLAEDVNMVPHAMSGNYTKSSNGDYGIYNFAIYNTPVDAGGFISGAGELICFTLISPYSATMDLDKLAGSYSDVVVSAPGITYKPFTFLAGMYEEFYGSYMPQGSFYCRYGDSMEMETLGLFAKGNVDVTKDGDNITLKANMLTMQNKRVTVECTAPSSSFYDYSSYAKPFMQVSRSSGNLKRAIPVRK